MAPATACGSSSGGIGGSARGADSGASVEIDGKELAIAEPDNYAFVCKSTDTPPPNMTVYYTKLERRWIRSLGAEKWANANGPVSIQVDVSVDNAYANMDGPDKTRADFPQVRVSIADNLSTGTQYRVITKPQSSDGQGSGEGSANVSLSGDMMIATGTAEKYATTQRSDRTDYTPEGTAQFSIKLPCLNKVEPPQAATTTAHS